jgi:hypothetical protein
MTWLEMDMKEKISVLGLSTRNDATSTGGMENSNVAFRS